MVPTPGQQRPARPPAVGWLDILTAVLDAPDDRLVDDLITIAAAAVEERQSWRELARAAVHQLHDARRVEARLHDQLHALRDEFRRQCHIQEAA